MRTIILSVVSFVLLSCSHLELGRSLRPTPADWPTDGRDPGRTNLAGESLRPPLVLRWQGDVTGGIGNGSPLVVDSMLVIGTLRGELYVFDVRDGRRQGWVTLGDAIEGSPVVKGDIVYVAVSNSDESLLAYNLKEGKRLWAVDCGDIESSPVLAGDRIIVANVLGEVFCIDRENGEEAWTYSIPDNKHLKGFRSSPSVGDSTAVMGCEDGTLYALSIRSGELRWKVETGDPIVAPPMIENGTVYAANLGGRMTAVALETGTTEWVRNLGSPVFAGSARAAESILAVTSGGTLVALNPRSGEMNWKTELGGVVNAAPVIAGEFAYIGTLRKLLYAVDVRSGEIVYQQVLEGRVKTPPAVAFGTLFIATDDRSVLAFSPERQE